MLEDRRGQKIGDYMVFSEVVWLLGEGTVSYVTSQGGGFIELFVHKKRKWSKLIGVKLFFWGGAGGYWAWNTSMLVNIGWPPCSVFVGDGIIQQSLQLPINQLSSSQLNCTVFGMKPQPQRASCQWTRQTSRLYLWWSASASVLLKAAPQTQRFLLWVNTQLWRHERSSAKVVIAPAAAAASGLRRPVYSQSVSLVFDVLPVIRVQKMCT